jgi:hypothetical protein
MDLIQLLLDILLLVAAGVELMRDKMLLPVDLVVALVLMLMLQVLLVLDTLLQDHLIRKVIQEDHLDHLVEVVEVELLLLDNQDLVDLEVVEVVLLQNIQYQILMEPRDHSLGDI